MQIYQGDRRKTFKPSFSLIAQPHQPCRMVGGESRHAMPVHRMALQFTLFHRNVQILHPSSLVVVIPIQTTGFYNVNFFRVWKYAGKLSYPSKRQASTTSYRPQAYQQVFVVIPIQTTGFYNVNFFRVWKYAGKLSYPSKRQASTTHWYLYQGMGG